MLFHPNKLQGSFVIEPEPRRDHRGFFARMFCEAEFKARDLETAFVQANSSANIKAGTLRGMHYQLGNAAEVKVVRCTAGAIFDVALDLRPDSRSFCQWFGAVLTAQNYLMLYIPRGCAHGFITLEENSEVFYSVSNHYTPAEERCARFDDPQFKIEWPIPVEHISEKDNAARKFDPIYHSVNALRGLL